MTDDETDDELADLIRRLRTREAALVAVAQAVAALDESDFIADDNGNTGYMTQYIDPIIKQARALLASDKSSH
jgi:hypothetical protein